MQKNDTDLPYKKSNRETMQTPKRGRKYWCNYCDANLVHDNEKCSVCKNTRRTKTLKKDI